jgi:indolepyruvate decarboxylase
LAALIAGSSKEKKVMTKRKTDASAVNVADYIVERLAAEGIDHCFGVAGDYAFPICDAVDSSAKMKWIGCANELNASSRQHFLRAPAR